MKNIPLFFKQVGIYTSLFRHIGIRKMGIAIKESIRRLREPTDKRISTKHTPFDRSIAKKQG